MKIKVRSGSWRLHLTETFGQLSEWLFKMFPVADMVCRQRPSIRRRKPINKKRSHKEIWCSWDVSEVCWRQLGLGLGVHLGRPDLMSV